MSLILPQTANMGSSQTGLVGTIGVELLNPDGTTKTARSTSDIYEIGGGTYGKEITFDDDWSGVIVWDTGGGTPYYATTEYNIEGMIDAVPTTAEFEARTLLAAEYATAAKLDNLSSGTAATNKTASSATITTGSETNDYTDTADKDGVVHSVADDGGTTDFYYTFQLGANGVPVSIQWEGYANSQGDSYTFYAWKWGTSTWGQVGSIDGASGSTIVPLISDLTVDHVGTGANAGEVRFRIYSTDGTNISTDRILCSFSTVYQSVGYVDGAVWVDTSKSNTGTVDFVDGVADNPVSTVLAAVTIAVSLGLNSFHVANGSDIVFSSTIDSFIAFGDNWNIDFNGQLFEGISVKGANITGIGTSVTTPSIFYNCNFGATTIPPGTFINCGIGADSGTFTGGSAGDYTFINCFSLVPGSWAPNFVFSGLGDTAGINNRGWLGGANYTLDGDCTVSHEVLAGGGQTFTTGGANVELRGVYRSATFTLSGAGLVQIHGVIGDITLSGAATTTVKITGVSASLSDTSSGTTVTDSSVSSDDVGYILEDTAAIADIPTVSEFNARSLPSADYVIVSDTIAGVTAVTDRVTANVDQLDSDAQSLTDLKDFADAGYDPATNKVQGVVLVDTTTTNTDMVTLADVADSVLDEVVEDGHTLRELLRGFLAALAGKTSGGGTNTVTFRDSADSKDRITATVDSSRNRTAITLDLS